MSTQLHQYHKSNNQFNTYLSLLWNYNNKAIGSFHRKTEPRQNGNQLGSVNGVRYEISKLNL